MNKKWYMIFVSLVLVGLLAACSGTAPAAQNPVVRQINVNGTGKVYLVPDVAYVYLGVRSQAEDVATALNENNAQAKKIADTLTERGVAAEDIQTTAFNVYPSPEYGPDGQVIRNLYVVENTVFVTLRDLQNFGSLLDAIVRAGANNINGISFDVADRTAAEAQARQLAVEDAKAKAAELAKLTGVELGDLITVGVYSSGGPVPVFEGKGGAAMMSADVPIAAGQLVITADASLSYGIK